MTGSPHLHQMHTRRRPARRTRLAALAAIGVTLAGLLAPSMASASTGSTPRTSEADIAEAANDALGSLQRWRERGRSTDFAMFTAARDDVATLAAEDLGVDAADTRAQLAGTSTLKQQIVLTAISQLGVPYRSMQSKPGEGFDCSGLTTYAFGARGVEIPRISSDQISDATALDKEQAEAGDLVYYPGHVGIYLGGDIYVHSPYSGSFVEISKLPQRSLRYGDIVPEALNVASQPGFAAPVVFR